MSKALRESARPVVLVVEDQPLVRLDLAAELTERGFEVVDAEDGETGIGLFRDRPDIDAAVVDIDLPGAMNGYDLTRAIRNLRPAATVVIISGSDFVMPSDFDEHVIVESKPLDMAKIALVLSMRCAGTMRPPPDRG